MAVWFAAPTTFKYCEVQMDKALRSLKGCDIHFKPGGKSLVPQPPQDSQLTHPPPSCGDPASLISPFLWLLELLLTPPAI